MNSVIRLKDDSLHIINSIDDFLSLVEETMGLDSRAFIEEYIILAED